METELRPLTLGEILDRTFQLYRNNFLLFTGIAIVAAVVRLLWGAAVLLASRSLMAHHNLTGLQILSAITSVLSFLVFFIAAGLTFAALTYAVSRIYLAQSTSVTEAYRQVQTKVARYTGLNLAAVALGWSPALLLIVVLAVAVGLAPKISSTGAARGLAAAYGFGGLLFLLVLPLCIWLSSRYSLANAAVVSESLTIRAALRRSVLLSKDTRGRIILALICIAILQGVVGFIAIVPIFGRIARTAAHPPVWLTAYQLGVGFINDTLFVPLYGIVLALFYYDARIRKEGFDVDWLLERSGAARDVMEVRQTHAADAGTLPG